MEQQEVKLLGFRCENHNIIKIVELAPDIATQQLIQIVGDSGNGKSSLLDGLMTAIHGQNAIKKKDSLQNGFLAEVQLLDGDIKLFVGARKRELTKGQRQGEFEVETYLYAKDDSGKQYTPIIDGEQATAAKYMKLLTTELTFSMPDFFTENQTRHRVLIEKLFKDEMDALGADETFAAIKELRDKRDEARALTQRNGAYMEQFEAEGYNEEYLSELSEVDIAYLDKRIKDGEIAKDRILNPSEADYKLKVAQLDAEYLASKQALKDEISGLKTKIRIDAETKQEKYLASKRDYDVQEEQRKKFEELFRVIFEAGAQFFGDDADGWLSVAEPVQKRMDSISAQLTLTEPTLETANEEMAKALSEREASLAALESTPPTYPVFEKPDTTKIDEGIAMLQKAKESGLKINVLVERFKYWTEWIEAKGKYEAKVDELRRMYARIETGVPGLKIVPVDTNTDKVEVWLKYNGEYNTEFFMNDKKESRYIFDYSSFQRSAIGVMLQAARLNLKPKALRLAIVDDVAFTQKGLSVLSDLCKSLNVKLITSRTDDITKDQIKDGEVLMQGGEAFFKEEE